MSLFDDNIKDVPVTADSLREMLHLRRVHKGDEDIERYNKILLRIRKVVEYTIDTEVWEYELSLGAVGCYDGNPFSTGYTKKINDMIQEHVPVQKIVDWAKENVREYDAQFTKFMNFMHDKGFNIRFKMYTFLESKDRVNDKLVVISWKEEQE